MSNPVSFHPLQKAASPRLSNETIDFPGARISADKFVGLRYVREGGDLSQSGAASPSARLLGAIQDFPSRTAVAAGKTMTSLLSVLPSPRRSSSGGEKAGANQMEAGGGGQEQETSTPRNGTASAAEVSSLSATSNLYGHRIDLISAIKGPFEVFLTTLRHLCKAKFVEALNLYFVLI